jgi:hypothetical protein
MANTPVFKPIKKPATFKEQAFFERGVSALACGADVRTNGRQVDCCRTSIV